MQELTLKKGTWFYYRTNDRSAIAEIIDYQVDPHNANLYWFQCQHRFNLDTNEAMDADGSGEILISSREFEQFSRLNLMTEEEALGAIRDLINDGPEETEEELPGVQGLIQRAERTQRPTTADLGRVADVFAGQAQRVPQVPRAQRVDLDDRDDSDDSDDRDATAEPVEREYESVSIFRPFDHLEPSISSINIKVPLGSGDMKTLIKIYEAKPERSWEAINASIEQTGHLLLTYTSAETRRKIIDQKTQDLLGHTWLTREINDLYLLEYNGKTTKAVYLGGSHWLVEPDEENNIDGFKGRFFVGTDRRDLEMFKIQAISDNSFKERILLSRSEINPNLLEDLADPRNGADIGTRKIYCIGESERDFVPIEDIDKNWEQAFVYNYYLGDGIESRFDLKSFKDTDSIKLLAEARDDSVVLDALV